MQHARQFAAFQGPNTISSQMGKKVCIHNMVSSSRHRSQDMVSLQRPGLHRILVEGRQSLAPAYCPWCNLRWKRTNLNSNTTWSASLSDRTLHHLQGHTLSHNMPESLSEYPWMEHSWEFPFSCRPLEKRPSTIFWRFCRNLCTSCVAWKFSCQNSGKVANCWFG